MNPRGREIDHCDWKPLAVPKGYRENYDEIKWDSSKAIDQDEDTPCCLHCGEAVEFLPTPDAHEHPDLFKCKKCDLISAEEDNEIEWK